MPPIRFRFCVALVAVAAVTTLMVPTAAAQPRQGPPRDSESGLVEATLARMSVEEKVGQLFWTRAYGASAHDATYAAQNQAAYGVPTAAEVVQKYHLGGVLYFAWAGNTNNPQQMAELSNSLQEVATGQPSGVPLSLSIDQEGGIVARMLEPATVLPGNMALGATRDESLAADQWRITGAELRATGVNTNFAPVVDVNTNAANPVIGVRSFGEDPDLVGRMGAVATRELQAENVAATLKHFPGHGDTSVDSHYGLPTVTYDRETLDRVHLAPFRSAIAEKPDAIMTAHIIVQAVDPELPATLSRKVLTDLLRRELGYKGLIVTDSLDMAGVRAEWGDDRVPVLALKAGADVLLNPPDMDTAYNAVVDAVGSGEISVKRLDESVRRILEMKVRRGLFADPYTTSERVSSTVGTAGNLAVADAIADRAATLIRDDADAIPMAAANGENVFVTGPSLGRPGVVGDELARRGFTATVQATGTNPTAAQRAAAVAAAEDADIVVVTTYNAWRSISQQGFVRDLVDTGTPVAVIATRDPYDINRLPEVSTFLATYGNRAVSLRAAARVLVGERPATGVLPVTVPTADGDGVLYPYGHGVQS